MDVVRAMVTQNGVTRRGHLVSCQQHALQYHLERMFGQEGEGESLPEAPEQDAWQTTVQSLTSCYAQRERWHWRCLVRHDAETWLPDMPGCRLRRRLAAAASQWC